MLGKILKYDLKSMGKSLLPLYAGLIGMALILKLLSFGTDSFSVLQIIYNFMLVFFIIFEIGAIFYTFFVAIKRYYKNLYSDEGYLTHTLPVTSGQLLISKVTTSLLYFILTIIIMLLSIMICFDTSELFKLIFEGISYLAVALSVSEMAIYIWCVIFMLVSYLSYVLLVYAGIGLGQSHSNNKIIFSVVYSVVLYYITQIIAVVALGLLFVISPDIMSAINQNNPSPEIIIQVLIYSLGLCVVVTIGYYLIAYNRLKHLNLN